MIRTFSFPQVDLLCAS